MDLVSRIQKARGKKPEPEATPIPKQPKELEQVLFYEPFERLKEETAKIVLFKSEEGYYLRGSFDYCYYSDIVKKFQLEANAIRITGTTIWDGIPNRFESSKKSFEVIGGCEIELLDTNTLLVFNASREYGGPVTPRQDAERLLKDFLSRNGLSYSVQTKL